MTDTHRMLPQSWLRLARAQRRHRDARRAAVFRDAVLCRPRHDGDDRCDAGARAVHLLVGATGLVSLGHGAFYGLAAYVVYLLSPEGAARPIWQTLPAAMAVAGVAALAVGALSLRTRGFFFLMVTLAFGQMIFFVFHDTKLGGGTDGAYLAKPLIAVFGLRDQSASLPRARRAWPAYYVALVQLVATYLILAFLLRSMFGRVLEGIKVNEPRMRAIGLQRLPLQARRLHHRRHARRRRRTHVEPAHRVRESRAGRLARSRPRRCSSSCSAASARSPARWSARSRSTASARPRS